MDAKYLAEIRARDSAELPETAAPVFRDRHALLAEVERLNCELSRIRSNAADDKKMLQKDSTVKDQQIATLKTALEMACTDLSDREYPPSNVEQGTKENIKFYIHQAQQLTHKTQGAKK